MVMPSSKKQKQDKSRGVFFAIGALLFAALTVWWLLLSKTKTKTKASVLGSSWAVLSKDGSASGGSMHLSAKSILANGHPYILYGTAWKKDETASLVSQAIHAGFRFIDTACQPKHYNEAGVGEGWKTAASQLGLDRSDIFLQTKFTAVNGQDPNNIPYDKDAELEDQVKQSLETSLKNLQTDYIDSLLLHSPMRKIEETLRVWKVFESFVESGKVRRIGISNAYDIGYFRHFYREAEVKPWALQNRFFKESKFDITLRKVCDAYDVKYQSFWTLTANKKAIGLPKWKEIAESKGLTPQTLMYAFMMTLGHAPLSGTTDSVHMEEDVKVMTRIQEGEKIINKDELQGLSDMLGMRPSH